MDRWNELRTAYKLAKLKTLSATANELGIHRSTVMRHIDALEENLGIKLFQRNDKGYIPTESGLEIMQLGEVTDERFNQFANKAKNRDEMSGGTLTLTCVEDMGKLLVPSIAEYQRLYPQMQVEVKGDTRIYQLEYGEADLAVRTGPKPTTPDNVVIPFHNVELVLCASRQYINQHGMPSAGNLTSHRFIALNERSEHLKWNEWIYNVAEPKQIVFTSSAHQILHNALLQGCGIGFTTRHTIEANSDLTEIPIDKHWQIPIWILVHRDMINIPKIRKFLDILKQQRGVRVEV